VLAAILLAMRNLPARRRSKDMVMEAHEQGFFTEENSADVVIGRNAKAQNERLAQVMEVITSAPSCRRQGDRTDPGGMVRGDHVPDQDRPDVQ
jgi:hypothetical protein